MSVIAWDGQTLAADRRTCFGTLVGTTRKIFLSRGHLCAYAGEASGGEEMLAWFAAGAKPEDFPASQRDRDNWTGLLVICPGGTIRKYENGPYPVNLPPQNFAIGSGRDFAMAAMHLGKTAREAVEVACALDNCCGNGIDELTL